tara:strand:+ start:346 stop:564 length:219 start_codon:yes stop_codon:yes gene_type:complete
MAFKGTAAKSASGASMSKYDVEVEARLVALEKAVADIAAKCDARASGGGSDSRVDAIINHLAQKEDVSDITG